MAGETKVGLLAGLTFIICFAIILANRGRQEPVNPHLLQLADRAGVSSEAGAPPSLAGQDPEPQWNQPASHSSPVVGPQSHTRQSVSGTPREVDHVASVADQDERGARGAMPQPRQVPTASPSDIPLEPSMPHRTRNANPPTRYEAQQTDSARRRTDLQERLDELSATLALQTRPNGSVRVDAERAAPPAPESTTPRTPAAPVARYKVLPGDTLTKIANKQYGNGSRRVINAIFDANRSLLASPDQIRVGMELILPAIEGFEVPSSAMPSPRPSNSQPQGDAPKRDDPRGEDFRWYQIQKNDRYVSIARRELGDESRWREIYELNKEKFPDAGRIREGVRIKLPVLKVVVSGKGES